MAKAWCLRGREAILQKVVFEVRYRFGFTYLDTCGRTVNTIMREHPEWLLRSESANPQNAPLLSLSNSCVFNFSALKYDLSLERPPDKDPLSEEDVNLFAQQADDLHAITVDSLGLREFTRIGFRAWLLFPCSSEEESETWLRGLGCYRIEPGLVSALGASVDSSSFSVVVVGEDRKYRIALNGVEQQAQIDFGQGILGVRARDLNEKQKEFLKKQLAVKKRLRQAPEFAAMIDVDAFQELPKIIAPRDFIATSMAQFRAGLSKAVREGG